MLKEAIDKIEQLAQAAWKPHTVEPTLESRFGAFLTKDGVEFYEKPPAPVAHHLKSLTDLVAVCVEAKAKAIWHDTAAIIGVWGDDLRDRVTLPLTKTTDFAAIEALRGRIARMGQKQFVDFLAYTLGVDKTVIQPFRRLDWHGQQGATGVAEFGASKMGKQIEATVLGIDSLPQTIILDTKMYRENVGQGTIAIRCEVDIEPSGQTLALVPDEKDLDVAIEAVQARIEAAILDLRGADRMGVYYGHP